MESINLNNVDQLVEKLETLGLPVFNTVVYYEDAKPPYLMVVEGEPYIFRADNVVFFQEKRFLVEIYSYKKEYEIEQQIESLLTDLGLAYEKSADQFDPDEELVVITYQIEGGSY